MIRAIFALAALACTAAAASAGYPACHAAPVYYKPYYAPAPYYPTYNTYVGYPVAVYAVPGTPTATINVYPGQFNTIIQPQSPAVNVTVNVAGQPAQVQPAPQSK